MEGQDNNKRKKSIQNAGLAGAQTEVVHRYGNAAHVHYVAYSGIDNEKGQRLAKGLKDISESKINPAYRDANIKQQAGFSAEVKTAARESSEKIIQGDNRTKVVRTDDMAKQLDGRGHVIGGKNDQLYDIAEVDANGIYIEGSARQLKYVGGNPKECTQKLLDKKYDKYRNAKTPLEVPVDFYDDVNKELNARIDTLHKQILRAEEAGNAELAKQHREQLHRVEKTKHSLRKGKLTNDEAIHARLHPAISTAKEVAKISHQAGSEGAKTGAIIGGGISFIQNTVSVIKGDKKPGDAIVDIFGDTARAATVSYATGFVGTMVKGAMQNAPSTYMRSLSKTNLPATLVVSALEVGKTLSRYGNGEIDGVQCLTELGEKGTGMLASAAGSATGCTLALYASAAIGQTLIPIPVVGAVGGLIGGMVGYALSTAYYNSIVTVLNDAKIAHQERLQIEAECRMAIVAMREYRIEIELAAGNYFREYIAVFQSALEEMDTAYRTGNTDQFIGGANSITRKLGGTPQFGTKEEFDALMRKPETIIL